MNGQELNIVINAQDKTKEAFSSSQSGLAKFKDGVEGLKPTFTKMAAIGTVAFGAIAAGAVSMVNAYSEAEADMVVANQSIKNSLDSLSEDAYQKLSDTLDGLGPTFDKVTAKMNEAGKAAVQLGFDDEEASKSFAKLFAVTKDVAGANKELAIAQDLARFKGISLEEATQKLVMVHAGATKELKSLGIAVDENATAQQNLDSIYKQVTGTAEQYAQTTKGQMEILQVSIGNLKESIGAALAPAFAKVLEAVRPLIEKFAAWAEANPELLAKIIMIAGAIAGLVAVIGTLGVILPAIIAGFTLLAGTAGVVIAIIVALGFAVYQIIQIFQILKNDGDLIWEGIKIIITEKINAVKAVITSVLNFIKALWTTVWGGIRDFFKEIWASITDTAQSAIKKIKDFLSPILDMIENVISKLKSIGSSVTGGIKKAAGKVGDFLGINDGIVQNGRIITTHPDDYIVATKTPETLGGKGGGIVLNIMGGNYLSESAAEEFGDIIIKKLQFQMRGS